MSRRRFLSTEISTDSAVNQLAVKCGDFAALLYTWMIPHADDDCTVDADPWELMMNVCPGRRDKTEADIQKALDGMLALGLIERCEDPGRLRFPPESFYKYQTYITGDRRNPAPAAQNSAERRETAQKGASFSSSLEVKLEDSVKLETGGLGGAAAPSPPPAASPIKTIWDHYRETIQPKARICPESKIRTRLKRFSVEDLATAIERFAANYWWMAHNAKQGAEWFFESDSQIDRFLLLEPESREQCEARNSHSNGKSREKGSHVYSQRNHI